MNRRELIAAGVAGISTTALGAMNAQAEKPDPNNPELEKIRALMEAHDKAMTDHDLDGVLACLSDGASMMGTGPGEMWSGKEELKDAYEHFFMVYDKGEQDFEYHFRVGELSSEMGWMMTSGNVSGKKDGKEFAYPLNVSITVAKAGDEWKIAAMHFSTLTGRDK